MPAAEGSHDNSKVLDNLCRISPDLLDDTCEPILTYLQGQTKGVDSTEISDKFQRNGVLLDQEALQSMIRFLLLTFRSAAKNKLSAEQLVSKLEGESKRWSKASLQVFHRLWTEHGPSVCSQQDVQNMLSIGQLVDMQWRLGMSVSSDSYKSLNFPYVCLLLKIAEPSGQICQKTFEMSIPQFQNLHKQFKEMAAVMDTV